MASISPTLAAENTEHESGISTMAPSPKVIKIWKNHYTIHSYQVDIKSKATVVALCQILQESAWQHAEHLGLGFSHLEEKKCIWVLARQLIRINFYPQWGDAIEVHTWPTGKDRIFCYRDFKILAPDKSTAAEATSTWFVIDLVTRKPQKTALYYHLELPERVERVFPHRLQKVEPLDAEDVIKLIEVSYGDLDMHRHVNNVRYVEWILNCLSCEFLSTHILREIEINHMSEGSYGDEVSVSYARKGKSLFLHRIMRRKDNIEICRARTVWEQSGG
jgi:acyl-ACP thioesterase